MMKNRSPRKVLILLLCVLLAFACGFLAATLLKPATPATPAAPAEEQPAQRDASLHVDNPAYEFLVGSAVYQLSAETDSLILQGFDNVKKNVDALVRQCEDESDSDWQLVTNPDGSKEMYRLGKRVAIICDIDDTLVNGINYTADILGNSGDWNNAAFARFLMSDSCTALPGAVDCVNYCVENGVEVYYITNRYDQGYKVGQSDSQGSYDAYVAEHGEGAYTATDGTLIGTTLYQLYGKSVYDITLESMRKLGFPIDDSHLIVHDNKLYGPSKEEARQAVINGCTDYSNGQRENENSLNTRLTVSLEPHEVVMLLGDQMTDFTDDFDNGTLDAVTRKALAETLQAHFGTDWIVFPNAVYGTAIDAGTAYGPETLFKEFAY